MQRVKRILAVRSHLKSFARCKSLSLSYAHFPGDVPLVASTLADCIDEAAHVYGDREAVVDCQHSIRAHYVPYIKQINDFAAGLLSLGLQMGDRVGVWCPNRFEWCVSAMAAIKAGLVLVPLNPAFQPSEVDYCVRKVGMRALITDRSFRSQDYYQLLTRIIPEVENTKPGDKIKSKKHPSLDTVVMLGEEELNGVVRYADVFNSFGKEQTEMVQEVKRKIQSDATAIIIFTSGTTGQPKGAMLSHSTFVNGSIQMRKRFLHDPQKSVRICCVPPLFHIFGLANVVSCYVNGNTIVLPSTTYSAEATLAAIQNEKCDSLHGTATMFVDVLQHPQLKSTDCSSLKKILMGGSLCPAPLLQKIKDEWDCDMIYTSYGASETCGGVTVTHYEDPWEDALVSCGPPYEHIEIKLVDNRGKIVPQGVRGEICVRGYRNMQGYWQDEEKTKEVLTPDGWYHTGDIGIMLEHGRLQIVDRIKDMIIRGGENIYPKEVEDLLMTHPKISEAYVIGVPDERLNEEVCVWVRLRPQQTMNQEELADFCKGKLAYFKIPKYVRWVENFPKTLSGKVQKHLMRAEEAKLRSSSN